MTADEIRLILATGGPGVVHASYTSGKPALGVGGGNAPVLVDELADLQVACGSIISGKVCHAQYAQLHGTQYANLSIVFLCRHLITA